MLGWWQVGHMDMWVGRMRDQATRGLGFAEMSARAYGAPGSVAGCGSPDNILILGGKTPGVEALAGRTLGDIAKSRGTSPEDAISDLVIADHSRVQVAYFMVPEAGVRREIGSASCRERVCQYV